MENNTLETEDFQKVKNYISEYNSLHEEIEKIEEKFKLLEKEKDLVLNRLVELRNDEVEFNDYIREKYGEIKLNHTTGKYNI